MLLLLLMIYLLLFPLWFPLPKSTWRAPPATSGNWLDRGNWSPSRLPCANETVTIKTNQNNSTIVVNLLGSSVVPIFDVRLGPGSSIQLELGGGLTFLYRTDAILDSDGSHCYDVQLGDAGPSSSTASFPIEAVIAIVVFVIVLALAAILVARRQIQSKASGLKQHTVSLMKVIPPENVTAESLIWQGNGTSISIAHLNEHGKSTIPVMLKKLAPETSQATREAFLAEMMIVANLPPSPTIIKFIGSIQKTNPPQMVLEFLPNGNLRDYLQNATPVSSKVLLGFIQQIALGMKHLESHHIFHGQLSCRNVLVGADGTTCKIFHFGVGQDDIRGAIADSILWHWAAPESIDSSELSIQADVWSFAVTAWEACSHGSLPFSSIKYKAELLKSIRGGHVLDQPPACSNFLYLLLTNCWNLDPKKRPTFAEICSTLESEGSFPRWEVELMYLRLDNFAADSDFDAHKNENAVSARGLSDVPYVRSSNESLKNESPVSGPGSMAPHYVVAESADSETRKYESRVVNMPDEYDDVLYDLADREPAHKEDDEYFYDD